MEEKTPLIPAVIIAVYSLGFTDVCIHVSLGSYELVKAPTETGCIDLLSGYYLPLLKFVLSELSVNKGGNISQQ